MRILFHTRPIRAYVIPYGTEVVRAADTMCVQQNRSHFGLEKDLDIN